MTDCADKGSCILLLSVCATGSLESFLVAEVSTGERGRCGDIDRVVLPGGWPLIGRSVAVLSLARLGPGRGDPFTLRLISRYASLTDWIADSGPSRPFRISTFPGTEDFFSRRSTTVNIVNL